MRHVWSHETGYVLGSIITTNGHIINTTIGTILLQISEMIPNQMRNAEDSISNTHDTNEINQALSTNSKVNTCLSDAI